MPDLQIRVLTRQAVCSMYTTWRLHILKLEYWGYLVPLPVYCLQLVITFTLILYTCVDEVHDIVLSKIKSVNLYQCCNVVG